MQTDVTDGFEHATAETYALGCECEFCQAWGRVWESIKLDKTAKLLAGVESVDDPDACWQWTRALTGEGYARVGWKGWSQLGHRVAYELLVGPIPDGLQIDHKCRNRACVNPKHLHPVTSKQNNENRSATPDTASGHRNVHWVESRARWCVQVKHDRRSYWGGSFLDRDDAVAAARDLRARLFTNSLADG